MGDSPRLLVGIDLGKATISVAAGEISEEGSLKNIRTSSERHLGKPVEAFKKYYRELDHRSLLGIAATGIFSNRLAEPVVTGVPEEIAQEIATTKLYSGNGPINVFRLGARGYSVLTRNGNGRCAYEENDKCSAGTGETIEKICGRLGLPLDEAVRRADSAVKSIPITARCSVFAKTEMTHFANQGEPHEELLRGYFESVARNLIAFFEKNKVDGPVVLIGNGARIDPVAEAFMKMTSSVARVADEAGVYDAIGTLYYAAEREWDRAVAWPAEPEPLIRVKERRIFSLKPAEDCPGSVVRLTEEKREVAPDTPAVLGIDLGSTGSKAVLLDAETREVIADVYRRTDGNPVEAAKALVAELSEMTDHPVVAIGLTGSGRDAAATVLRAAYPDQESGIFVQNEIVAHATAAVRYDPDKGRSMSIVEIGGQDAKFINLQNGRVLESDMNRACSAGTGSFLEEQGIFYGIRDVTRFGEMAAASKNPPNLGQMCTVFVADLASEAINEGYTLEDVFAGFQYSVIINYKNRVMGTRRFMDRIFFQGKPATNPSLARTLAAVTGREVYIPPNPGAMGAIGIAMLARESIGKLNGTKPFDLGKILAARVISRREVRCNDKDCKHLCRIESATVEIEAEERKIMSGGSCPKFEAISAGPRKLPKEAPNPYIEREELLRGLLRKDKQAKDGPTVGLPYGHYMIDYLPFFHAFFAKLGARVEVIRSGPDTLSTGNRRCTANNTCTPVKVMHGLARTDLDYLLLPKVIGIPRLVEKSGSSTCPMTQGVPEMIEKALEAEGADVKVIRPVFQLGKQGFRSRKFIFALIKSCLKLARDPRLKGRSVWCFFSAYREALARQREFEEGLHAIGRRAIRFAKEDGSPVVLVTGNSHVIHEPIMNARVHDVIFKNGAIALPLDCFPIPDWVPPLRRVYWGMSGRLLRASIAAAKDGGIFPLLIVGYSCGPSSFVEHLFNDLLEDYPHTVLESDGHGGQAGYVTRVQAFLHTARSYEKGERDAIPPEKIRQYNTYPHYTRKQIRDSKIAVMTVGPNFARHVAAMLRSRGYDAETSGLTDLAGLRMGREACSAKECLPYQLVWGSFRKYLEENPPADGKKTMLLNVGGIGPCRNGMFPLANEIALRRMGFDGKVDVIAYEVISRDAVAFGGIWLSMVGSDLLNQMRFHFRPVERDRGESDRLFAEYSERLEKVLEKPGRARNLVKAITEKVAPVEELLVEAAKAYRVLPIRPEAEKDIRTVFLCGDVYLRVDEWGSDDLARKLNDLGIRVQPQPFADLLEYLAAVRSMNVVGMDSTPIGNWLTRRTQRSVSRRLSGAVNRVLPWVHWDDIRDILRESRELIDGWPITEAVSNIGCALYSWRTKPVDGLVMVGPWGCGPSMLTEAQLRRRTDIPAFFIYYDGDPIDEARLAGFAWRIKRSPRRQADDGRSAARIA